MGLVRDALNGPWRAVVVLGITQILAWGTLFYPPVLVLPLVAAERGWSLAFAMGGLSLGLLIAGLASPRVGRLIDRFGGHRVMPFGSLMGALGLVGLTVAASPAGYLAVWMLLGTAIAASLYDPAFASLGRIFGAAARRPITALTLAGGLASTVSWPVTHLLLSGVGWRGTYLIYAAALALVAAPLHAVALPRWRAEPQPHPAAVADPPRLLLASDGAAFVAVAVAFAAYAFVPSGLAAHLLAMFARFGLEPATVVMIGALFGPAQVIARIGEMLLVRHVHPLTVVRAALALLLAGFALIGWLGISAPTAAAFAVMFGMANGLVTIARGTLPLALFGVAGYGVLIGRIARPALVAQALAPLVLAFTAEHLSDRSALALVAACTVMALVSFLAIRRPGR
jgi:MFS family permease